MILCQVVFGMSQKDGDGCCQYIVSEYNNGLVKTHLMKYVLTTAEVYRSTTRFSEQQDTVRELRQSEAATSQRTAVCQKKKYGHFQKEKKSFFYEVQGF